MFASPDSQPPPPIHPAAAALFAAALAFWLLALDQPGAVAGGVAAAFGWLAAERRLAPVVSMALPPAFLMAAINTLFAGCGSSVIARLPSWWPGGGAVTIEAAAFGFSSGAKLAAVIAVFAVWSRLAETDRSIGLLGRAAPRTAVILAIVIRWIPGLLRDARRIHGVLWSRGVDLASGNVRRTAASAGLLWRTLLASSLEGAHDLSEALAARGFGSGRATSFDPWRFSARDAAFAAAALALVSAAAVALLSGRGLYAFYPGCAPIRIPETIGLAAAPAAASLGAWIAWRMPVSRRARTRASHD